MKTEYSVLNKKKRSKCKCIFHYSVAILLCFSISCFAVIFNDKYVKDNTYGKDYLLKNQTSFRRQLRYLHHIKTCDDYKWGCCEIYHDCTVVNDSIIDYRTITLKTYPKNDENGSNCPRVYELINNHNLHYPIANNCHEHEYGCCKLNYVCDMRVNYLTDDESHNRWAYKYSIMHNYLLKDLVNFKATGCPTYKSLAIEYLEKYPQATDDVAFVLWFFAIVALVILHCMASID